MKKQYAPQKQNKSDIAKTDRDNQQESFINDQILKDSKHEPSKSIKKDSEELAAKRSKKTSQIPKEDKTEVMDDGKRNDSALSSPNYPSADKATKKKGVAPKDQTLLPSSPKRK